MFVVIAGSVIDGHTIYGPFSDTEDAIEWAESNLRNANWEVVEVEEAN